MSNLDDTQFCAQCEKLAQELERWKEGFRLNSEESDRRYERAERAEKQARELATAMNNIIWAVNVALSREGSSEGKVRIGGIAQEALANFEAKEGEK